MSDKYCANCGTRLSAETAFCPQCGAKQDLQNYSAPSQQNMQGYGGETPQYKQNYQGAAPQYTQNYQGFAPQYTQNYQGVAPQYTPGSGVPPVKKNKAPLIIAICAAVMAVIVGSVMIGLKIGSNGNNQYDSTYNGNTNGGNSTPSGGESSLPGSVSFSGNGSSSSGSENSYSDSYTDNRNAWNLSSGETSLTVTDSNGNSVSITQQAAAYTHGLGYYGYNQNQFYLTVTFSDAGGIMLIMDISENDCQEGLSLSSRDFDASTKMGLWTADVINGNNLYNTYEHPQMIGNVSFRLEEYSTNSAVFYIKADFVYMDMVYTLEGYGCSDRFENDPMPLTEDEQFLYEEQNGTCTTCHGSGKCPTCGGMGTYAGVTCQGCFGSGRCWSCEGTGRSH